MIDALVARMTRAEKLAQLQSVRFGDIATDGELDDAKLERLCGDGIGYVTRIGVESGHSLAGVTHIVCELQHFLCTRTRLGVPALVAEEALSGLCAHGATQFPQAIGLASARDAALVEEVSRAIASEMTAVGADVALAPVVDVARDPRWGRLEETFGEDPELVARLAVAYVRGLQSGGVAATAKHFVAHGASEGGVNCGDVSLGPRRLREVHLAPFEAVIKEASVAHVMTAYHALDGEPCTASRALLRDVLRGELGFTGVVVSDFWAINHLVSQHGMACDDADAAHMAFAAGVDVDLPTRGCFALLDAPEHEIDAAVRRVLEQKCGRRRAGAVTTHARDLALRAATRSFVLLTNDGVLPLARDALARVAVIGPTADDPSVMLGDYSYAHQRADYAGSAPRIGFVSPLAALRSALPSHVEVAYERGAPLVGDADSEELARARAAAAAADVAIVFVGGRSGTGPDATSGELRDTNDLRLARGQRCLLAAIVDTGTPTACVVISGRAYAVGNDFDRVGAALLAWLPGEQGGTAIARVLLGDDGPTGRLPVSLLHRTGDVGTGNARFPFGHGLTYPASPPTLRP